MHGSIAWIWIDTSHITFVVHDSTVQPIDSRGMRRHQSGKNVVYGCYSRLAGANIIMMRSVNTMGTPKDRSDGSESKQLHVGCSCFTVPLASNCSYFQHDPGQLRDLPSCVEKCNRP